MADAAKTEYAAFIVEADAWATRMKAYAAAVEKALDHSAYDQKKRELDKARDAVNAAVDQAGQIKANAFGDPGSLTKLASKVAEKAGDLTIPLTRLTEAAKAISNLQLPDKIP